MAPACVMSERDCVCCRVASESKHSSNYNDSERGGTYGFRVSATVTVTLRTRAELSLSPRTF